MKTTETPTPARRRSPIFWVPTAYFGMGLPFVVLNMVAVLMYKGLGVSDAKIAFWTSLIMLPWTLKPLWSPLLEMYRTKKFFVVLTQMVSCPGHDHHRPAQRADRAPEHRASDQSDRARGPGPDHYPAARAAAGRKRLPLPPPALIFLLISCRSLWAASKIAPHNFSIMKKENNYEKDDLSS